MSNFLIKESLLSKLTIRTTLLLCLLFFISANVTHAQGFSPYFGAGSATDSAGTSSGCPPGQLSDEPFAPTCEPGPTIGGAFGVFGADVMFGHIGFNAEYAFRFAQATYLPNLALKMRPAFYDFNAVYEPTSGSEKRIVPVIEGGIGGNRITLYYSQTYCVTSICSTSSYASGLTANHFQVHGAAGVKLYVKDGLFIKPQVDFHWVNNLTQQFNSDWVPQYTVSIGYTFGEH